MNPSLRERIQSSVAIDERGCWIWKRHCKDSGYGRITLRTNGSRRVVGAHCVAFEEWIGAIPSGMELDHLCRVRQCVNPDHLEPVTHRVNMLRGDTFAARNNEKTHCNQGHPFDLINTYVRPNGKRACRTCRVIAKRRSRAKAA